MLRLFLFSPHMQIFGKYYEIQILYRTADISLAAEIAQRYISAVRYKNVIGIEGLGIKLINVERLLKTYLLKFSPQSWCWNVLISEKRGL